MWGATGRSVRDWVGVQRVPRDEMSSCGYAQRRWRVKVSGRVGESELSSLFAALFLEIHLNLFLVLFDLLFD